MDENIPTNWINCFLEDVISRITNGSSAKQYNEKVGYPITRIETIWNEKIDLHRVKYVKEHENEFVEKYSLKKDDILLSHINSDSHLGKTAIFKNETEILIHGINLLLIRSSSILYADFLNYQFKYLKFKGVFIDAAQRAVNQSSINQRKLKAFNIKLPPLPEQRAIVFKLEQLFSDLDNGIENFKKAQEQLKIYRQAVLKKAFEGKLTKKWREEQIYLPSADELIQQVKEERAKQYQKQLDKWKLAVKNWDDGGKEGKKTTKPKKTKELPPLSEKELKDLTKLPEGWCWVKLDAFGELFCGQSPATSEVNTEGCGMLYISGPEQWNGVKIENNKWTEHPKRIVPDGCIFITVKGAGVGKLFPGVPCAIGRDIYAYRPFKIINFDYVNNALKHGIDLVIMKAKGDIPGLSKNHILDHFIGLPSIEEQSQIVQEIETRLSICDNMETTITESLQKAESLRQSILKKAFEGKLLNERELEEARNAPDWEPAEKLLERIKAEKTNMKAKKKGGK